MAALRQKVARVTPRAAVGAAGREFVKMEWSRGRFAANVARPYGDAPGLSAAGASRAGEVLGAASGEAG
jgi:hypothetical protein